MSSRVLTVFFGLCLLCLLNLQYSTIQEPRQRDAAPGTEHDPFARTRYEFERLKDPATGTIPDNIRARELAHARTMPTRTQLTRSGKGSRSLSIDWQFRGPMNIGGRTRAFAVDVSNTDILLAGGVSGGMWRSEDRGDTWHRTTKLSDLKSVTCLVQDTRPGKTSTWYFGTGEARANSAGLRSAYYGDGIGKSTDGGRTWQQLEATLSRTPHRLDDLDHIMSVAIDPSNLTQDELYCATTRAIYRSIDGGTNWDLVLGSNSGPRGYAEVISTSNGVMYATISSSSSTSGLWRSLDGIEWTEITPQGFPEYCDRTVIAAAPGDERQVYFFSSTPQSGKNNHSLWKYTNADGAEEWENRSNNLPERIETYDSYCQTLSVHPSNAEIVYIGGRDLYRSNDGFATPNQVKDIGGAGGGGHHADNHLAIFDPENSEIMYTTNDGGVYVTHDPTSASVNWVDLNHGYTTSQFYTVAIDHLTPGSDYIIGGMQDNGTWSSNNGATTWNRVWGSDGAYCFVANGGAQVYVSEQQGVIHRVDLDENGAKIKDDRLDPAAAFDYDFINPFTVDPNDHNILYVAEASRIWRMTEGGSVSNPADDEPLTQGWTSFSAASNQTVTALRVGANPGNRLYYGTSNGKLYRLDDASEPGSSPVLLSQGKLPSGYISAIDTDPRDDDHVVVSYSSYGVISVFNSTNGGETWTAIAGNLEESPNGSGAGPSVKHVRMLVRNDAVMYFVGTTTGLYSTSKLDGMNTVWVQEAEDVIGNTVVDMIDVRHTDGFVVAATHGTGVYSANVELSGGTGSVATLSTLEASAYPNPFTTKTSVKVDESISGTLSIYSASGSLVRSASIAPTRTIEWDGRDNAGRAVTVGTYLLELKSERGTIRQKLVKR